jgi:hypothetical protein
MWGDGADTSCWSTAGRPGLAAPLARRSLDEALSDSPLARMQKADGYDGLTENCGLRVPSVWVLLPADLLC